MSEEEEYEEEEEEEEEEEDNPQEEIKKDEGPSLNEFAKYQQFGNYHRTGPFFYESPMMSSYQPIQAMQPLQPMFSNQNFYKPPTYPSFYPSNPAQYQYQPQPHPWNNAQLQNMNGPSQQVNYLSSYANMIPSRQYQPQQQNQQAPPPPKKKEYQDDGFQRYLETKKNFNKWKADMNKGAEEAKKPTKPTIPQPSDNDYQDYLEFLEFKKFREIQRSNSQHHKNAPSQIPMHEDQSFVVERDNRPPQRATGSQRQLTFEQRDKVMNDFTPKRNPSEVRQQSNTAYSRDYAQSKFLRPAIQQVNHQVTKEEQQQMINLAINQLRKDNK